MEEGTGLRLLQCDEGPEGEGWPDATIAAALDVPARRRAVPGVYAQARPLAPQGRTGTERPDAADPVPAQAAVTAWAENRNAAPKGIHWPFRTADARVRLKHLYPTI